MSVLIVAAHPDDEVLGCGGTIARLCREDEKVTLLILGEGVTSRSGLSSAEQKNNLARLHQQSQAVSSHLGADGLYLENFPDNRFDTVPLLDIIKKIEELISHTQPHTLYTQHGGDLNIDHAITFKAVLTAARPSMDCPVQNLYSFEVPSATDWSWQKFAPRFTPSRFVDIGPFLEQKIQVMALYSDEIRPFPHPRSEEAIKATALKWGSTAGMMAAEAFEIIYEKV